MKTLMIAVTAVALGFSSSIALAQEDPDFGIEIQNNTVCSFINGNNVNIRQEPISGSRVVAVLNRGDGVRAVGRDGNWVQLAALTQGYPPQERFIPLQGWVSNRFINGCAEDEFDRWRQ